MAQAGLRVEALLLLIRCESESRVALHCRVRGNGQKKIDLFSPITPGVRKAGLV